jgi:hypothetical protein
MEQSTLDTADLLDTAHSLDFDADELMLLQLTEATSRSIASKPPPSSQRDIDRLEGMEKHLVRESQIEEIMTMIADGKILPVDGRTVSSLHELDGKWVVKYKKKLDGLLERVRVRWVLRGDRQVPWRDFDPKRIYSPVATKTTTFCLFVVALHWELFLYVLDVSKAFTMGPLDIPNFHIKVPPGFRSFHPDWCPYGEYTTYLLLCSLYGLRQAAAIYYETMKALVLNAEFPDGKSFACSPSDPCLFIRAQLGDESYTAFSLHIDDKFIACGSLKARDELASVFDKAGWKYTLEGMEKVLGFGVQYDRIGGTLQICHQQSLEDAYTKFKPHMPVDKCSPVTLPVDLSTAHEILAEGPNSWENYDRERHKLYRSVLGTCAHCANYSHPEIAFAISLASQHMANPSEKHLTLAFHILRYLYGNRTKKMTMRRSAKFDLNKLVTILCDADLGGDRHSSRSRTAWYAFFFGVLVGWNSRLQPSVSLSTAEAEYTALASAGRFAVWIRGLLADFGIETSLTVPVTILSDNQSAIAIAESPVPIMHKHSRHIDRRLHWLKEKVHSAEILLGFVPTDMNVSDIGTKPLAKSKFVAFRDKLLYGYQSPLVVPDGTSHFLQHVHLNMHYTSVDSQQFEPVFALALFPLSRLQRPFKTTPQLQLQQ